MQILDYPSAPLRKVVLTKEERQLIEQCYKDIRNLISQQHVTTTVNDSVSSTQS